MDYASMILAVMLLPLAAALVMAVLPSRHAPRGVYVALHLVSIVGVLVMAFMLIAQVVSTGKPLDAVGLWFHLDALGCVFVGLIGAIGFLTGLFSVPYIKHDVDVGNLTAGQVKQYYVFFSLFIFTMLVVALSNNIIMMWVGIEATTLSTVFLVGSYNKKPTLEAAWKYVIVCTAGVAFGLYGTVLVYANAADVMADAHQAAFWTAILPYASQFDGVLMQIAFVFAVIGFGTKAGLFPMHTWLPDAHSEAPAPVSGLLSGVLLKCAVLVIIRFYILTMQAVGPAFPQTVLLIIGIVSVCFAALSVLTQDDLKRKLAYHSCENVGLVALFLGFGGPLGVAAALLHCVMHGFTKAMLFCISGNVLMKYGTRDLNKISGLIHVAPVTAVLLAIGFFALAGTPPFAMFVSEITGIIAGIKVGMWPLVILLVAALTVVVAACAHVVTVAVLGDAPKGVKKGDVSALALFPEIVATVMIVWFGVAMPQPMVQDVEEATAIVLPQEDTAALHETPFVENLFAGTSVEAHADTLPCD